MKFLGLIVLVCVFASIGYSAKLMTDKQRSQYRSPPDNIKPLIAKAKPNTNQQRQISVATKQIDVLLEKQKPAKFYESFVGLPTGKKKKVVVEEPVIIDPGHIFRLSMVFISKTNKYAVIDDEFVNVGSTLIEDAKVLAINPGQVTINHEGKTKTLNVPGYQPML